MFIIFKDYSPFLFLHKGAQSGEKILGLDKKSPPPTKPKTQQSEKYKVCYLHDYEVKYQKLLHEVG